MNKTSIAWTDYSWPVVNGCRRISPGCEHCYAERLAATRLCKTPKYKGLSVFGEHGPRWTGETRLWEHDLDGPLKLRTPSKIFVADMGDLFYEGVSDETIATVFGVMRRCSQHTFQVLTKRPERARAFDWSGCPPNIWIGVSAEDQQRADERIPILLSIPAAVRFVSYEPALEAVSFAPWLFRPYDDPRRLRIGLDWVICGGESGPDARPFDLAWARTVRDDCNTVGVPFFMKQFGRRIIGDHTGFKLVNRWIRDDGSEWRPPVIGEHARERPTNAVGFTLFDRAGGDPTEWPFDLCVRQFPQVGR